VPILPSQFDTCPAFELLVEAEAGRIGFDHRLLNSLLARPAEALPALVRFAEEKRADALLDLDEQAFDLFRQFNSPQAIPFYLRRIEQASDGIPDELVEAFAALGAPAVDPLLDAIASADEDDRGDLVFLLAALGVRDARIPALLEGVLDADPYEGALCVGLYGDPALIPLVERALAALPAEEALQQERKALEDCRAQLQAGETVRDVPAFDIFALYAEIAPPHFEALPEDQVEEYLTCDCPEYRADAALSLCDEEYNEDTRDALLARARADSDPQVRAACHSAAFAMPRRRCAISFSRRWTAPISRRPNAPPPSSLCPTGRARACCTTLFTRCTRSPSRAPPRWKPCGAATIRATGATSART
jgi:hypothetical protein